MLKLGRRTSPIDFLFHMFLNINVTRVENVVCYNRTGSSMDAANAGVGTETPKRWECGVGFAILQSNVSTWTLPVE